MEEEFEIAYLYADKRDMFEITHENCENLFNEIINVNKDIDIRNILKWANHNDFAYNTLNRVSDRNDKNNWVDFIPHDEQWLSWRNAEQLLVAEIRYYLQWIFGCDSSKTNIYYGWDDDDFNDLENTLKSIDF